MYNEEKEVSSSSKFLSAVQLLINNIKYKVLSNLFQAQDEIKIKINDISRIFLYTDHDVISIVRCMMVHGQHSRKYEKSPNYIPIKIRYVTARSGEKD